MIRGKEGSSNPVVTLLARARLVKTVARRVASFPAIDTPVVLLLQSRCGAQLCGASVSYPYDGVVHTEHSSYASSPLLYLSLEAAKPKHTEPPLKTTNKTFLSSPFFYILCNVKYSNLQKKLFVSPSPHVLTKGKIRLVKIKLM